MLEIKKNCSKSHLSNFHDIPEIQNFSIDFKNWGFTFLLNFSQDVITSKELIVSSGVVHANSLEPILAQASASKPSAVSSSSAVPTSSNICPRTLPTVTSQSTIPVPVVKQEDVISSPKREPVPVMSSLGQIAVPSSSTMSPMHVEIKKESNIEETTSPQSRVTESGDTATSVTGDSSTGVQLDAQGC